MVGCSNALCSSLQEIGLASLGAPEDKVKQLATVG